MASLGSKAKHEVNSGQWTVGWQVINVVMSSVVVVS